MHQQKTSGRIDQPDFTLVPWSDKNAKTSMEALLHTPPVTEEFSNATFTSTTIERKA